MTDPDITELLDGLQGSGKELEVLGELRKYRQEALGLAGQPDAERRIGEARERLRERLQALQKQ